LDAVSALVGDARAAFGEAPGGLDQHALLAILEGGALEFLLARADDSPVGIVSLACAATVEGAGLFAWLDDLFVLAPHRRRGIGTQLVSAALARARERGASEVRLAAAMGDAGLVALYRRAGFASSGQALMTIAVDGAGPGR
jgi:GNAT superfamily N-acetyltransferase